MTSESRRIYLIDGSAMIYRAYFAFARNPLINSKGENTSASFGFINSLLKVIREEKPDEIVVVFDTKFPTFRHERYSEYKSTRAKMPQELVDQLPRIREAAKALNVPTLELPGFEADDIIGTIARKKAAAGYTVWCVTGDKDYFQLVTDRVFIYIPKKVAEEPERCGRNEVKTRFGVYPEQVIDKLALMGDSSDNVPGVPGIGPKTADALIEQFGTLDAVYENIEKISAKGTREKLAANKESAYLSKELVTIHLDVPIEISDEELRAKPIHYEEAKRLFFEMEFKSLIKELVPPDSASATVASVSASAQGPFDLTASVAPSAKVNYRLISTIEDLRVLIDSLLTLSEVAIDTETTGLDSLQAGLVGVSLCGKSGESWYIPFGHTDAATPNIPRDEGLRELARLLSSPSVQKFGQNIKYDLHIFRHVGLEVDPVGFDSMLASYVIDPSSRQHSLDNLALKHFDYKMQPINDLIGSGRSQKSFADVPVEQATFYAAEDADYTYRLRGALAPLVHDGDMQHLYYNIELPLVKVLFEMEEAGVRIDIPFLKQLSEQMGIKITSLEERIYEMAGMKFNINSTQQLSHILFEKMALPTKGKTAKKTGFSTDVGVLEELALLHPFPKLILEYRQYTKLRSTYVDAIPLLINPNTGRVHTTFNQAVAATGRLASSDPNLQNIPIRTEEGREIRKAFIPRREDYLILAADYSQIELRILAHYAKDAALIEAFHQGQDIHARTAAEVFGVDVTTVTKDQRRVAKTANFAIIYGVTAFGLSQQTEMTVEQSKQFIETYFSRYPGIRNYMEETRQFARDKGFVTTLFNRRRALPEMHAKIPAVRQFAERTAINTPIQGTAADIIKLAMISIQKRLTGFESKMVLQVHDELVFDVHKSELEKVREIVRAEMEGATRLAVPLVADIGVGENWLEAK